MLLEQGPGPQPPRDVTTPLEIQSLLKALQISRTPLEIRFDGRSPIFQSFIVDLASQNDTFYIDELIPSVGDKWISQGGPCRIDAWLDGVHLRWQNSSATLIQLHDGAPAFSLPLPAQLIYHQRRGAFRAQIHRSIATRLELIHSGRQHALAGELLDISATGCKVRIPGDLMQTLQPGERYEFSQLQLEEGLRLAVDAEIRHRVYSEASNETLVGVYFHPPPVQTQRHIDRFVNQLQRDARRLEKEDLF